MELREVQKHENRMFGDFGGAAFAHWRLGDEGLRPLSPPARAFGVPGAPPPDPRPAGGCLWFLPLLRAQWQGSPVTVAKPCDPIQYPGLKSQPSVRNCAHDYLQIYA